MVGIRERGGNQHIDRVQPIPTPDNKQPNDEGKPRMRSKVESTSLPFRHSIPVMSKKYSQIY
jgi:hypothetical protein